MTTRWERPPERMLTVVGVGFVIAGVAGYLGFSLAVGALFAGLVFSVDSAATQTEDAFNVGGGWQGDRDLVTCASGDLHEGRDNAEYQYGSAGRNRHGHCGGWRSTGQSSGLTKPLRGNGAGLRHHLRPGACRPAHTDRGESSGEINQSKY